MDKSIGIVVRLPEKFNIKLERHLVDLKEKGIRKNKADLVCEFAQIGLIEAIKELNKMAMSNSS